MYYRKLILLYNHINNFDKIFTYLLLIVILLLIKIFLLGYIHYKIYKKNF